MARKLSLLLAFIFVISINARAQGLEVFGGYSYKRLGRSPGSNLNGVEVSAQYKIVPLVGIVADVDSHFGSPSGIDTRVMDFMVGPQISFPSRISPFLHVLGGIGHIRSGGFTDTSFATAVGGGIDMRVVPMFSWRAIQVDDVVTRFFGSTQHSARISTGIVFRF